LEKTDGEYMTKVFCDVITLLIALIIRSVAKYIIRNFFDGRRIPLRDGSVITAKSNPRLYAFHKGLVTFFFVHIPTIGAVMQLVLVIGDLYQII
jgi:hypothetical protein